MPAPADDLDLDAIRRELEERRRSTRERVALLAERPELGTAQGFGKRIGDGTTEAISRLTDIGVGRSLETGLERTERALAKLDEGTYGICDSCGEPISPARLQAMLDSVLCVACAASERRPQAPRRR
jgi:DnaK suppressor protein